jgi:hypothetical protein
VRLWFRLKRSEDVESKISASGLERLRNGAGWYCVRIGPEDLSKSRELLRELLKMSFDHWS